MSWQLGRADWFLGFLAMQILTASIKSRCLGSADSFHGDPSDTYEGCNYMYSECQPH
jgi:hypothetical protein